MIEIILKGQYPGPQGQTFAAGIQSEMIVSGAATDVQSASEFLDDGTVQFTMGSNVYSGPIIWAGRYTALMPAGTHEIEALRSGYPLQG